jgi:glycosyltransferase involved in cell wall biosynthesis
MPAISVLMPVYNAERYVAEAVESILVQSQDDLELLVVDDGSTDRSLTILRGFAERDARVRLSSRSNRGILETRNELLALARGEFVAIMDADDVALPGRLGTQHDYMLTNPTCVGVGSWVQTIDEEGQPLALWRFPVLHDEIDEANLSSQQTILHSAFFARRAAMIGVGCYRQELCEDLDLFLRLAEVGRLANLPEALVKYRRHHESVTHTRPARLLEIAAETIEDARRRRGLDPAALGQDGPNPVPRPAANHRTWAWVALGAGHLPTARKHAMAALRLNPLAAESWRVVYCALRGY